MLTFFRNVFQNVRDIWDVIGLGVLVLTVLFAIADLIWMVSLLIRYPREKREEEAFKKILGILGKPKMYINK